MLSLLSDEQKKNPIKDKFFSMIFEERRLPRWWKIEKEEEKGDERLFSLSRKTDQQTWFLMDKFDMFGVNSNDRWLTRTVISFRISSRVSWKRNE